MSEKEIIVDETEKQEESKTQEEAIEQEGQKAAMTSSTDAPVLPEEKRKGGIECRYCNDKENPDRVAHLVCIEMSDGHIHVHAPFGDRRAIYRFLDAIEVELGRHKRVPEPIKREDALK